MDSKSSEYDYLAKIILVGNAGVGKTHILQRYDAGKLPQNKPPTIGVEFATKTVPMRDGRSVIKA